MLLWACLGALSLIETAARADAVDGVGGCVPYADATPEAPDAVGATATPDVPDAAVTTTVLTVEGTETGAPRDRSPWRVAVGGFVVGNETRGLVEGDAGGFLERETSRGGVVAVTYDLTRQVGFTGFVGGRSTRFLEGVRLVVGGDVQFAPFRLPVAGSDVFELGVLAGASNLLTTEAEDVAWHVGARGNVNLAATFGLTAAVRFNADRWMAEGGVVASL